MSDSLGVVYLGPDIQIDKYVDTTERSIEWIQNHLTLFRVQNAGVTLSKDSIYWALFQVHKMDSNPWLLELPDPHLTDIEVFYIDSSGKVLHHYGPFGYTYSFDLKSIQHKNHVVEIPEYSGKMTVLVKTRSFMTSSLTVILKRQSFFISYSLVEYVLLGIYYGIILIMGIYNLFLFFSTRDSLYLLYILYVIGCAFNSFTEDGLGFQFLWPNHPAWNLYITFLTPVFLLSVFILYSNAFLELKKYEPNWYRAVWIAFGVFVSIHLYNYFTQPRLTLTAFYLLPYLLLYLSSFLMYWQGKKFARFYVLAYSMIVLSFVIFILRTMGMIKNELYIIYSFNLGFLTEVVILSIALSDRFKMERVQKEAAQSTVIQQLKENEDLKNTLIEELRTKEELQDKVNRELEVKVNERTIDLKHKSEELENFNQKLSGLIDELNSMNIKLDLDNWQLKQKVQEEVKARLTDEVLTQERFKEIYPNEAACLRYLEELKWGNGYHCIKCGHNKYMAHQSPFVRKCTTCKHVESVTASTLFHGVRIPLDKAFYIVYDTVRNSNPQTLEALSDYLALNKNTIWGFRKKIHTYIETYQKKYKHEPKWEEVMMHK
ncbi:MAG: 7TM diverse intracellular signaling domain-containing protein [Cytophagaceae bacterium]